MRPECGAEQVIGIAHVRDPVAKRFVDRVFQGLGTGFHTAHFCAHQFHAKHIERLPLHVLGTHVDDALESEACADRGCGDAMLTGAGLGNDAALAHATRKQHLPQRIVDLVRASVAEVFALQQNLRATRVFAEALGVIERRGTSAELGKQSAQLALKLRVTACRRKGRS